MTALPPGPLFRRLLDAARPTARNFGIDPDSGQDETARLNDLAEAGGGVLIPAGGYTVNGTVTLEPGLRWEGEPGAEIVQTAAPAAPGAPRTYTVALASDTTLRGLTFTMDSPVSSTSGFYLFTAPGTLEHIRLEGITADYGQVIDPEDGTHNALGGVVALRDNASLDGLVIQDCKFSGFFWGFLKGNEEAGVQKNIAVRNSEFSDFGSVALLFNTPLPGATMANIEVTGCTLGPNHSRNQWFGGAGFGHKATFAGNARYFRFLNNHGWGEGDQFCRAEEGAAHGVIGLSTAECRGYNGFEIVPAQAGGDGMKTPQNLTIVGFNFEHVGVEEGHPKGPGTGLKFHANAGNPDANFWHTLEASIVGFHNVKGFDEGVRHSWGGHTVPTFWSVLDTCTIGARLYQPSLVHTDLVTVDCDTDVHFDYGGLMGRAHFRRRTPGPFEAIVTRTRGRPGFARGWTWETGYYDTPSYAASSIYLLPIIRTGTRMQGTITASLYQRGGFLHTVERGTLSWDGTTFTYTSLARETTGSLVISATAFVRDSEKLALRLSTGAGGVYAGVLLQVAFDGLHVFN